MTFYLDIWHAGSKVSIIGQSSLSQDERNAHVSAVNAVDWLKVQMTLGKPVTVQCGKTQALTTLCRVHCGVSEVCTLPSAVAQVGCLSSSLHWSGRCDLEWGLSSFLSFCIFGDSTSVF